MNHDRVTAVRAGGRDYASDAVISTVPIPLVSRLIPDLPQGWKDQYAAIRNIGVVCLLFKLRKSVTPHFWVNIVSDDIDIPGIIEFSNLRPRRRDYRLCSVLHAGNPAEMGMD